MRGEPECLVGVHLALECFQGVPFGSLLVQDDGGLLVLDDPANWDVLGNQNREGIELSEQVSYVVEVVFIDSGVVVAEDDDLPAIFQLQLKYFLAPAEALHLGGLEVGVGVGVDVVPDHALPLLLGEELLMLALEDGADFALELLKHEGDVGALEFLLEVLVNERVDCLEL